MAGSCLASYTRESKVGCAFCDQGIGEHMPLLQPGPSSPRAVRLRLPDRCGVYIDHMTQTTSDASVSPAVIDLILVTKQMDAQLFLVRALFVITGPDEIRTARMLVRKPCAADAPQMFNAYAQDSAGLAPTCRHRRNARGD